MSKSNTLFSYFSKSPAPNKSININGNTGNVLSPKRSPNSSKKPLKNGTPSSAKDKTTDIQLGDVVWTRLEGYPWWPGMVCKNPTEEIYYKAGRAPLIHVQFFDEPISRGWVKERYVKPFLGADDPQVLKGGVYHSLSAKCRRGIIEADDAMKMTVDNRLKLVVDLQPSDESEEEEDNTMDFDPDIFDDEMSDEPDNSKENCEAEENGKKKTPKKTPSKSPKKNGRRSERKKPKRRRIMETAESGEESEDSFEPSSEDDSDGSLSSGLDEKNLSGPETESDDESPTKTSGKRKKPGGSVSSTPKLDRTQTTISFSTPLAKTSSSGFTPVVSEKTKSKLASFSAPATPATGSTSDDGAAFAYLSYDFLQPAKIKDAKGNYRTDPDYDSRSIFIPDSFKKNQTPGMKQWWDIKAKHFDTILFFKMGKFYELFHMDAAIGVNELGLVYMRGEQAHCGFPEISYGRYSSTLIQKGYKVARIEQTETPDMMADRIKSMSLPSSKFDKVVRREVCQITSRGTKTYSFLDGDCVESQSSYLIAIAEKEVGNDGCSTYGVCFIDTSIGKFHIGQFLDDRHCSRLRTLMAHYTPTQLLFERGKMSQKTQKVINGLTSVIKESLSSGSEFWDSGKTLKYLAESEYFTDDETKFEWPGDLKSMVTGASSVGLSAKDEFNLGISALGAVTWYLQYSLVDHELLSMKNFEEYKPLDGTKNAPSKKSDDFSASQRHMILDGTTLSNLDIVENNSSGTLEGSLLERLDQCSTPFGKRLLRQWLCAPLCNPRAINDRLDAIEDLINNQDAVSEATELMKKIPDLERLLSKIHTLGSATKSRNHPNSRAILYEDVRYSKRRIEDFLGALGGFKQASKIAKLFKKNIAEFRSQLLKKTLAVKANDTDGCFPDLSEALDYFDNAFDHDKARKDGVVVPTSGVDEDYDAAVADIKTAESKLNDYLDKQRQRLGCKAIVYWGSGKNRYQMEIPEKVAKNVPDEYEVTSSKKGWKRYRTRQISRHLYEIMDAEERKDVALKDVMRRIYHSFDDKYAQWSSAVQCLSVLDVLICLSQYSRCGDGVVCRPEIISPGDAEPFIEIRDGRHPCIYRTFSGSDFIPNDTVVGIEDESEMDDGTAHGNSKVVLVTGPNMGGKSTLMRQVGLVVIMAQLGCFVPAEKCKITPVDRVFTRLGATDRIMSGESTFFVELSETSSILQHATKHSLVLVDELGRGTATYDGTAIACAVVKELSENLRCRTLFSTHYHSLVEEFSHDPNIRLGHMACMVENENEEDPTQETITFLYKFIRGACPKSYGFNAAKLANIPDEIIKVAQKKAKQFESSVDNLRLIRSLWKAKQADDIKVLQEQIVVS